MTAWESLVAGSALATGTAWDHLNAQGGGSSGDVYVVDAGPAELSTLALAGSALSEPMAADVTGDVSAVIEQVTLEGNINV